MKEGEFTGWTPLDGSQPTEQHGVAPLAVHVEEVKPASSFVGQAGPGGGFRSVFGTVPSAPLKQPK